MSLSKFASALQDFLVLTVLMAEVIWLIFLPDLFQQLLLLVFVLLLQSVLEQPVEVVMHTPKAKEEVVSQMLITILSSWVLVRVV